MKKIIAKLKRIGALILGALPSKTPAGIEEFKEWSASIRSLYRMPTEHQDSLDYALATMILNLGRTEAYKSKLYFALAIKAAASKQVASQIFQDIKQRQQAEAIAAQNTAAASSGQSV